MPIISSNVLSDTTQHDGRRSVTIRWTSSHGDNVDKSGLYPANYDTAAELISGTVEAENQLSEREYEKNLTALMSGAAVQTVLDGLKYLTTPQLLKKALVTLMKTNDPREVIALKAVALYVNATYTDAQIKAGLGVTQAKLDAYKARIRAVISDTGLTMEAQIVAMDSTLSQWGDE